MRVPQLCDEALCLKFSEPLFLTCEMTMIQLPQVMGIQGDIKLSGTLCLELCVAHCRCLNFLFYLTVSMCYSIVQLAFLTT